MTLDVFLNPVPTGTDRRSAPVESEATLENTKTNNVTYRSHGLCGGVD